MNRRLLTVLLIVTLVMGLLGPFGGFAGADPPPTLEEQIEESIVQGLAWLAAQQATDGSWGHGDCNRVSATGLVVLKFADRAREFGLDPLSEEYEYRAQVHDGLNFILAHQHEVEIDEQPAGDPDVNGNGIGVYWDAFCWDHYQIYNSGIAMMAIAAVGRPEDAVLLQDAVDYMAWAQIDKGCEPHRGGWGYNDNTCSWSDNSNAGYATLGLGFAQDAGATIPDFVKSELNIWIGVIQDQSGGDDHGGSWYNPDWPSWANTLKTGNLLYEMGLVGDTVADQRVKDAIGYIERHWENEDWCGSGWRNHRQAMFTMMKGFEGLGIELIDLDGDGIPEHDWFEEVAEHLIVTQNPDGSWPWDCWAGPVLSTAWALLTLQRAVPRFEIAVPFDILPTSCRNPFNVGARGVLPTAILGTAKLDVTQIDPASLKLVGVSPLRWAYEDVATPYEPYLGKEGCFDCTTEGPDGYMDLTVQFDRQAVAAAIGPVENGQCLVLTIEGTLKPEFGGTPIVGEDVIAIIRTGRR